MIFLVGKMRIVLIGVLLIQFGLVVFSFVQTGVMMERSVERSLAVILALSLVIAIVVPGAAVRWLIGGRIAQLRWFCAKVKHGNYRELLSLPNENGLAGDEEELTMLMRDMNWMARQIDIRQQEMIDSALRIEEQKHELLMINEQLRQIQIKKQQQSEELATLYQGMKKMAMTDPLTSIANRR
ncbi:hypothetical protein JZU71_01510, partial [bacterium]|nr:hypothetical protein [bacterium]